MKTVYLTSIIQRLGGLVDHDVHVSIDETKKHIRQGDVLDWLKEKFKIDIFNPPETQEFIWGLQELLGGRLKHGVQRDGICLLIVLSAELLAKRAYAATY